MRYIGNSNFPAWRIAEAEFTARAINVSRFVSCQDEYSLVVREIEKDLLPAAQQYNLGLLPFFPLASGLLTGKYKRGARGARRHPLWQGARACATAMSRHATRTSSRSCRLLRKRAATAMLELAFSWLASRPQVSSVIAGATRVEQVEQNVKAIATGR